MSEVGRVHGPGGSEPGAGRKDRTKIDEEFTKIMEIGNIDETDPHKKKGKQKAASDTEDVEAGLKAASGVPTTTPNVKPIENIDTPLAIKKTDTKTRLPPPTARPTTPHTPLASFDEQEIEKYAWEEDAATAADFHEEATTTSYTPSPASTASSKTETSRPSPPKETFSMETDSDFEEAKGTAGSTFKEDWPQTTSYSSSSFRSYSPSKEEGERPVYPTSTSRETRTSREEYVEKPKRKEQEERRLSPAAPRTEKAPSEKKPHEKEEEKTALAPKTPPPPAAKEKKEAPPLPGAPVLPGQKGPVLPFAAHMEPEEEKKEAIPPPPKTPAAAGGQPQKLKPDLTPKVPSSLPPESIPAKAKTKEPTEEIPVPLAGIPAAGAGFPSLKQTTPTTISSKKEKEEVEVEGMARPSLQPTLSQQGTDLGGDQGKKKREGETAEEIIAISGGVSTPAPAMSQAQAAAPLAPTPYVQMEPQIMAMFERMVGVMTIAHTTGISETTMTLNARQFANSVLYGSKIIIREFSTAPKAFNVEFIGSPQAVAQVQQNIPALLGAVKQGNFNFTINRFDAKLGSTEKPLFSRKGTVGDKENQERNDKDEET